MEKAASQVFAESVPILGSVLGSTGTVLSLAKIGYDIYKGDSKDLKSYKQLLKDLKESVEEAKKRERKTKEEVEKINKLLKAAKKQCEQLMKENNEISEEKARVEKQNTALTIRENTLREKNIKLEEERNELKEEAKELQKKNNELVKRKDKLENENLDLREKLEELQKWLEDEYKKNSEKYSDSVPVSQIDELSVTEEHVQAEYNDNVSHSTDKSKYSTASQEMTRDEKIKKDKENLSSLPSGVQVQFTNDGAEVTLKVGDYNVVVVIEYGENYPAEKPIVKFISNIQTKYHGDLTTVNFYNEMLIEWKANTKLKSLIKEIHYFLRMHVK